MRAYSFLLTYRMLHIYWSRVYFIRFNFAFSVNWNGTTSLEYYYARLHAWRLKHIAFLYCCTTKVYPSACTNLKVPSNRLRREQYRGTGFPNSKFSILSNVLFLLRLPYGWVQTQFSTRLLFCHLFSDATKDHSLFWAATMPKKGLSCLEIKSASRSARHRLFCPTVQLTTRTKSCKHSWSFVSHSLFAQMFFHASRSGMISLRHSNCILRSDQHFD